MCLQLLNIYDLLYAKTRNVITSIKVQSAQTILLKTISDLYLSLLSSLEINHRGILRNQQNIGERNYDFRKIIIVM